LQNPRPLPGDGWRLAALTLTLGEPAGDVRIRV
jgi:hypothetical protein